MVEALLAQFSPPKSASRKRTRQPDTEPMTQLRLEAAKAIKRKLGLSIEPAKVRFNGKPFPRRRTVYVWKSHGDLTQEERHVLSRTVESDLEQRRFFRRWSDSERAYIASLIRRGALVPEYHVGSDGLLDTPTGAWELHASDTEDDADTEAEELSEPTDEPPIGEPPAKRLRETPPKRDRESSHDRINIPSEPYPTVTPSPVQTENSISPRLFIRCSLQSSESRTGGSARGVAERQDSPTSSSTASAPLRTMTSNSSGILELNLRPVKETSPHPKLVPVAAPVAASPFTATTDPLASYVEHNSMDRDDDDDMAREIARVALMDMKKCMETYYSHATVGYLGIHQLRKEKRSLKKQFEEKVRQFEEKQRQFEEKERSFEEHLKSISAREAQLEEQLKLLVVRENGLKGRISSLEADRAKFEEDSVAWEKERKSFQQDKDDMQCRIDCLEQDLVCSKVAENHLRDNENVMKESYQHLEAEKEKLKNTAELETLGLKGQILSLRQTESELQRRLEEQSVAFSAREASLKEKIEALVAEKSRIINGFMSLINTETEETLSAS